MVQSLNTKVDLVIDATAFTGLTDYGQIMIGDRGFEFYHAKDPRKFIQIPWEEVDYVLVQRKMDSSLCDSNQEKWDVYVCFKRAEASVTSYS